MNQIVSNLVSLQRKKIRCPKKISLTALSFIICVLIPTFLVGIYYAFIASDQYRSDTLFAVRGTTTSPLSALGLAALPGASVQSGDSYIVSDYIRSTQVILDALNVNGVDLRHYFAKDSIDLLYRIDADMPFEQFVKYWRARSAVEFNSTTGITTFHIKAFSPEDANAISKIVVAVSEKLVNRLSDSARKELISTAQDEVNRTELRLKNARNSVEEFRNKEQALDPQLIAQSEQSIIRELQVALAEVQARRTALAQTTRDSPTLRVLDRRISAIELQIEDKKKRVGSGASNGAVDGPGENDSSLSRIYNAYSGLLLEQEFAEKAYTGALTALEQALVEARKQERYFAIVVEPTKPDAAMYPLGFLNTCLIFGGLVILWLLGYLVIQSVKDHAI